MRVRERAVRMASTSRSVSVAMAGDHLDCIKIGCNLALTDQTYMGVSGDSGPMNLPSARLTSLGFVL
jgi:hypothetical protein